MKVYRPLAVAVVSLVVCVSTFAQKIVFQAKVTDVQDGSIVVVETQSKTNFVVKCQATTAPKGEPYGQYSRQRLESLALGKMVTVEYTERNQYGQLLGTIFLDGDDLCLNQISVGLARFDPQAPGNLTTSRRELYASSEEYARNRATGVWSTQATVNQSAVSSVLAPNASPTGGTVDVSGYFRKDGTYVSPHKRTAPDNSFDNNWSTVGNVNPYTGKPGTKTKSWFARNWWIFPTVGALVGVGFLVPRLSNGGSGGGILCNDGTTSNAQNRQGACSHHGGIRR